MPTLYALSDPHLSASGRKPMDVFGPRWHNHAALIEANWRAMVGEADIVLVPGDISWAMRLEEALPDLEFLASLPGKKVLLRGNHDYWWQGIGKLRGLGLKNTYFIQNDHVVVDGVAIGGTRLWDFPFTKWTFVRNDDNPEVAEENRHLGAKTREDDPEKVRARELQRLEASLAGLPRDATLRVALTHFPPLADDGSPTPITDIIDRHAIDLCVYGHVHSLATIPHPAANVTIGQTRYVLAASDYLNHAPLPVWQG